MHHLACSAGYTNSVLDLLLLHILWFILSTFSPQSLFPLLQHFHTVSSSLGLLYSMQLLHVAGLFSLSICVTEVASRSFRAALQSYSMGPRLRGNPTVKSLSVFWQLLWNVTSPSSLKFIQYHCILLHHWALYKLLLLLLGCPYP